MPINKGGITSVGTHGWWKSEATACDYPDEDETKAGVVYADGAKTGTFVGELPVLALEVPNPELTLETP